MMGGGIGGSSSWVAAGRRQDDSGGCLGARWQAPPPVRRCDARPPTRISARAPACPGPHELPPPVPLPTTHSPEPAFYAVCNTRLIFPPTNVPLKLDPNKLPPLLSVPSTFRGRLKLSDQIRVARKLEYRKFLKNQEPMRLLIAPFAPASRIPAVQVPPHVIGGKTNWEEGHRLLALLYSLDPKLQLEHSRAATQSRSKLYETNIKLLCDNRPSPVNVLAECVPPAPLPEGAKCPLCGFFADAQRDGSSYILLGLFANVHLLGIACSALPSKSSWKNAPFATLLFNIC